MSASNLFLVPVDFSRGSDRALDYALSLARERKGKVVALHVVPVELIYPPTAGKFDFYGFLESDARKKFNKMIRRKKLRLEDCRFMVARGMDFADIIVRQAKKLDAAMIVMGSHGRTGLQRFLLGSVAERTLRYADRPVLIVKK